MVGDISQSHDYLHSNHSNPGLCNLVRGGEAIELAGSLQLALVHHPWRMKKFTSENYIQDDSTIKNGDFNVVLQSKMDGVNNQKLGFNKLQPQF